MMEDEIANGICDWHKKIWLMAFTMGPYGLHNHELWYIAQMATNIVICVILKALFWHNVDSRF